MKRRLLTSAAMATVLAASTFLGSTAEAQFVRASVTTELVRGLGGLNRLAPQNTSLRRYAIVIGNRDYEHIEDLKNANNDARAVAAFLRENDFTVFDDYDVDKRRFERLLRRALLEFDGNSEVLFYFAGHGMQIGRRNYLLPTDVTLENVHDVPFETVTLDQLLALLASRTRLQLIILDSCRENPFNRVKLATGLDAALFETSPGFTQASAPINTLLSFSTSPGALALDGEEGGNSPFTSAFINTARESSGQSITRILEEVRRRVYARTNGQQVPWESSTLVEPFLFRKKAAVEETLLASAPTNSSPPSSKQDAVTEGPPAAIADAASPSKLNLPPPTEAVLPEAIVAATSNAAETATDANTIGNALQPATAAPIAASNAPAEAASVAGTGSSAATVAAAEAAAKTATETDATNAVAAAKAVAAAEAAAATGDVMAATPEVAANAQVASLPGNAAPSVAEQSETVPAAPPQALEIAPEILIGLIAPLDRDISLGDRIAQVVDLPEGARVKVVNAPENGALVFHSGDAGSYASTGEGVELAFLTYDLNVDERSALNPGAAMIVDNFGLELEHDGQVTPLKVSLISEANACDVEAGDWLDPNGVGIARYPNQLQPEAALAACEAAVQSQPEVGRFHYQLGRALQALRRFDDAQASFTTARDLGHVRAWHAIGELTADRAIATGGGANERASDAVLANYAMGVQQGDAYAMHALGKQLLRYGKNKAEKEEGYELLSRAVEVGHTFAMNELGYYFLNKDSDNYQPARGLEYLKASAEREDIYGYNNMGLVYDRGLGDVEKDPKQALAWYLKAADGGHPYAPVNAGRIYYRGSHGAASNPAEAVRLYDMGLERGDGWGGANAAWIILNKPIKGLGPTDAAIRAAKAAALRGEKAAAQARGVIGKMNSRTLTTATQALLNEMGESVTVDGLYGGETRNAINALAEKLGFEPNLSSPQFRLLTTAQLYWRRNPLRLDLY